MFFHNLTTSLAHQLGFLDCQVVKSPLFPDKRVQLLPDKSNHRYNLRHRGHSLTLSIKTDARNLVVRQLFKDMY